MGRINLRCACGQPFVVDESVFDDADFARCPGCGRKVGIDGPILEREPRRRAAPKPAASLQAARKTHLILGGLAVGAVLFFGILISILAFSGGSNDREVASSGHGRRAAPRNAPEVRYSTDRFVRPMTTPSPQVEPPPKPPEINPLPPLPPPNRPTTTPLPAPRAPDPAPPGLPAPRIVPPAEPTPLSPDLVRRVREEVLSLPEYYLRSALPAESRTRAQARLASGKGTPEDVDFLNSLLSDLRLTSARHEYRSIQNRFAALEHEALSSLPTDQIKLTDGRTLTGRIVDVTPQSVRLERKIARGVGGVMSFPRSQVREIGKGKGIGGEFRKQWGGAKAAPVSKLESLLGWCEAKNLGLQAEMVAFAILLKDPGHQGARGVAKLSVRPPAPAGPRLDAPPPKSGPTIEYQGRAWAPRDLKARLLRSGYALIDGRWHRGRDLSVKVPGLFRYARQSSQPVIFSSGTAPLNHDSEVSYKSVYDVRSRSFAKQPQINHLRRFYAPTLRVMHTAATSTRSTATMKTYTSVDKTEPAPGTPLVGEVRMTIPLDRPLISASVKLKTEVKSGGRITLYLLTPRGRVKVHEITGDYGRSIELPSDHLLGATQVELLAELRMLAAYTTRSVRHQIRPFIRGDSRGRRGQQGIELIHQQAVPDYATRLFPSTSNTHEVFRLSAKVAEPAVGLDRLFEPFPEILGE